MDRNRALAGGMCPMPLTAIAGTIDVLRRSVGRNAARLSSRSSVQHRIDIASFDLGRVRTRSCGGRLRAHDQ